ncbi:MAG: glycosyltransferase family 39 protein [Candidatus Woesebacteria bacterium]|nr:glycosyltransferase family 39 protein [Candidatus Woesebacteria bacterium]
MKKILFILIIFGFLFRNLYTNTLAINFMYDQARDSIIVKEIINGDIKIQGPSANAPGLYHGVLYFYFLTIPYLLGNGSPIVADIWLSLFSSLTIIIVYYLCFYLTKDKKASFLSALFFTFSFEATQYALWLSNPSMAVWFVPLTYLSLWLWTTKNRKVFAILTGLFLGLSIQSDLFLIYHIVPISIWILVNRKKTSLTKTLYALLGLFAGIFTLIISEIKFGFQGINGLIYLFTGGDKIANSKSFFDFVVIYFSQLARLFSFNLLPTNIVYGGIFGLILVLWFITSKSKKYKLFLLLYLFAHFPIVFLGGLNSPYLTVGIGSAVCILAGIFISDIYMKSKFFAIIMIFIILFSNLSMIFQKNMYGQTIFSTRPQMLLSNLINVVDYTYLSSNGEKFSIDTVTAPLWLNTTWSAVYNWHGLTTYGFLPFWHGKDQVGYWGDNLIKTPETVTNYYLIIEPHAGIPAIYIKYAIDDENAKSNLIEEKDFGGITVQKREKII